MHSAHPLQKLQKILSLWIKGSKLVQAKQDGLSPPTAYKRTPSSTLPVLLMSL